MLLIQFQTIKIISKKHFKRTVSLYSLETYTDPGLLIFIRLAFLLCVKVKMAAGAGGDTEELRQPLVSLEDSGSEEEDGPPAKKSKMWSFSKDA